MDIKQFPDTVHVWKLTCYGCIFRMPKVQHNGVKYVTVQWCEKLNKITLMGNTCSEGRTYNATEHKTMGKG